MCVLFFFSLRLANSERSNHRRCSLKAVLKSCNIDRKIPVAEQAWNFIKKENPAQVFSYDFYEIFLDHLFYLENFWAPALSLLLESPVFWGFYSSDLPDVYLWVFWFTLHMFLFSCRVITIIQIVLTDPVNVLPMVLGKPLGFLIKSSPICLGQQNWNSLQLFCNNLAISYEWLKWKGINHSYLKKLLEW